MPPQFTRADALREYLTGANSDGGSQSVPDLSWGEYRSSTEAVSLGIQIANALSNVTVLYAGGGNPIGTGQLRAIDTNNLTWKPFGASGPGFPAQFVGSSDTEIVEGLISGQYLRITGTTPFTLGMSNITLSYIRNNLFGFDDVAVADAVSGVQQYRASIVRNEGYGPVSGWQRWLATLGTFQRSDAGQLGSSGSGVISTTGSFVDWPSTGWCQIQDFVHHLREVVYYSGRSNTSLTVPSAGRARLGTGQSPGQAIDFIYPVPGVAIGIDSGGIQNFGTTIQSIPNETTSPSGVTWNVGITAATGLQIGSLGLSKQIGLWIWRDIPAGAIATPSALVQFNNNFSAF